MNNRRIGSTFERIVSKEIVKACKDIGATQKDCYRTPLSGGHPFGDRGDLVVSPLLAPFLPFSVECKTSRRWTPGNMFTPGEMEKKWIAQVRKSAGKTLFPMLVMRGFRTDIFVALQEPDFKRYFENTRPRIDLRFIVGGSTADVWRMVPFDTFLRALRDRAKANNTITVKGKP
jgi:hypothetical protein